MLCYTYSPTLMKGISSSFAIRGCSLVGLKKVCKVEPVAAAGQRHWDEACRKWAFLNSLCSWLPKDKALLLKHTGFNLSYEFHFDVKMFLKCWKFNVSFGFPMHGNKLISKIRCGSQFEIFGNKILGIQIIYV